MALITVALGTHKSHRESWRRGLLACGIASSLLYGAMIWAIRYEGYSLVSQVPSELTAIGAPTQRLWTLLTFLEAQRLQTNLPTPWIGLWERINISTFLLWVAVLATTLLRARKSGGYPLEASLRRPTRPRNQGINANTPRLR